ncbi:MAG: hypothetical protein U5K38_09255 [Woeseiaceae bacterium]|nr:hypothetical protein [Woeseiaceae bacterium]
MNLKISVILYGVILSLVAGSALACGESLFRVGKGVAFRQYTAPLPGSILAVARTEAELLMIEQLVAAGHDVHVVAEPSQIRDELGEHEFDIVPAGPTASATPLPLRSTRAEPSTSRSPCAILPRNARQRIATSARSRVTTV